MYHRKTIAMDLLITRIWQLHEFNSKHFPIFIISIFFPRSRKCHDFFISRERRKKEREAYLAPRGSLCRGCNNVGRKAGSSIYPIANCCATRKPRTAAYQTFLIWPWGPRGGGAFFFDRETEYRVWVRRRSDEITWRRFWIVSVPDNDHEPFFSRPENKSTCKVFCRCCCCCSCCCFFIVNEEKSRLVPTKVRKIHFLPDRVSPELPTSIISHAFEQRDFWSEAGSKHYICLFFAS